MSLGMRLWKILPLFALFVACGDDDMPAMDASMTPDGGIDAGMVAQDAGPLCDPSGLYPIAPASPQRCSRDTAACVRSCETQECIDSCLAADTQPADATTGDVCGTCVFGQFLSCLDESGCEGAVEAYRCCEAECTSVESCPTQCATLLEAIYACALRPAAQGCGALYATAGDGCYPPRYDAEMCDDVALPERRPMDAPPRCAVETRTCLQGCGDDLECYFTCLAADMTEPSEAGENCGACVNNEYQACLASRGCEAEVRANHCCIEQNCDESSEAGCGYLWCGEEDTAANNCGYEVAEACGLEFAEGTSRCFPSE